MLPEPIETTPAEPIIEQPQPARPSREPFWDYTDVALVIGLTFAMLAVAAILVVVVYHGALLTDSPGLVLSSNLALYLFLYVAFRVAFKLRYGKPVFSSLGWRPARYNTLFVASGGVVLAFAISGLASLLHTPKINSEIEKLLESRSSLVMFGIMAVTIAPFFEELFFRGFLQPLLSRSFGVVAGVLLTALLFGSMHAPEYAWAWQYALAVALVGAVLGWVRARTGSIIPSTIMHACYNAVFFVAAAFQHPK
ncbi:MAG: CPBP family intramembrane metalloprotease [Acidobacteriaceae bacterium]|nr:CPBP family intramembrane metalloprotease [Acidobacteriaceae bacterium]MBV9297271.1 CPBP family intramembrane metalloprotease [Acidobacteriaceae bacterium]MBV9765516.1 CPBP family intramembrane metalloprotease [Acidobacteriaceae bacterium]